MLGVREYVGCGLGPLQSTAAWWWGPPGMVLFCVWVAWAVCCEEENEGWIEQHGFYVGLEEPTVGWLGWT